MEWTQLVVYSIYNVTAVPLVPIVFTGSTSYQLTIPYNMEINLTLEAIAPCRSNTTANIRLKYDQQCYIKFYRFNNDIVIITSWAANCGYPDLLLWRITNGSVPNIEGYDSLSIKGSTVRFSCPPSLALIGSNSATCTENGKWELNIPLVGQHVCNQKVTYIYYT